MKNAPYVRPVPRWSWYFAHARYMRYMLREATCILIGAYALMWVVGLVRLADGPEAWAGFLAALATPAGIAFHVVALAFALYHSCTWFNLTPKAMPLQHGDGFVPGAVIVGAHYAAWFVASLAVLFITGVL